jgi:hypothetical protein
MLRPPKPKYTDPENNYFHPPIVWAIERVLEKMGISENFSVKKQFASPTGPIDVVLFNQTSNRVSLVVEVKRTRQSVRGGGRRQARDYWTNLGNQMDTPFYCSTNLEVIELFRSDSSKPSTGAQLLVLDNRELPDLSQTDDDFYDCLLAQVELVIKTVLGLVPYKYSVSLEQLTKTLEASLEKQNLWNKTFIPIAFEYLRTAGAKSQRLKTTVSNWKTVSFYRNNLTRIKANLDLTGFHLLTHSADSVEDKEVFFNPSVIKEAAVAGAQGGTGEDLGSIVQDLVRSTTEVGVVETDPELAGLIATLGLSSLAPNALVSAGKIFDPAAGSGSVLVPALTSVFSEHDPARVIALEEDLRLGQVLDLRLGLWNPSTELNASPRVIVDSLTSLSRSDLADVKVVITNPPFLSGVQSARIKQRFADRIHQLSGQTSRLNSGQISLEALYLELLVQLVPTGTVIATVFPAQHLTRKSVEVANLRKWLIEGFGLIKVAQYSADGLFNGLVKQTIALVGISGVENSKQVSRIEVQLPLREIDFAEMSAAIDTEPNPTHGVTVSAVDASLLVQSAPEGWKQFFGAGQVAYEFILRHLSSYPKISSQPNFQIKRGVFGNKGNTGFLRVAKLNKDHPVIGSKIPNSWIVGLVNTTKGLVRFISQSDAPEISIIPPVDAYEQGSTNNTILVDALNEYISVSTVQTGKQKKNLSKTADDILLDMKATLKADTSGWVLVPRASRTRGQISYYDSGKVLISTNLLQIKGATTTDSKLVASWLLSIFGQIQLDFLSNSQEGQRKIEQGDLAQVHVPKLDQIPKAVSEPLINQFSLVEAIDFSAPKLRELDILWSKYLFGRDWESIANSALDAFAELSAERTVFGNQ